MRLLPWTLAATAAIGAWQLFIPVVNAQNQPDAPAQAPQAQSPSPAIPDQKLDATASAIKSVASIKRNYQQRMATAKDSQKQGIANEAADALKKAITDQGLSVEEYTNILEVAQNDPDVRQKIIQRIRSSVQPDHPSNQPDNPSNQPDQ
jgi:hypothetical protein